MRGRNFSWYEQSKTSPDTIEHELRSAVREQRHTDLRRILLTRRVPVEGKSSVCLICMKYRIIILIIIIISLGQILLSYIANTSRTHAHTCMRTHAHTRMGEHTHTPPPYMLPLFVGAQPRRPAPLAFIAGSRVIEINTRTGQPISPRFWMFFTYKKFARPNWDANSWQDVLSDDTNS